MTDQARQSATSPTFAEISVGEALTPLVRGPLTSAHLMRWSAAIENWHRIHYDERFAIEHEGLPGLLINGSWKQHFLVQMVRAWLGPDGWLAAISFRFRKMNLAGEMLTAWGTVIEKEAREDLGLIVCEIGIRNENGDESTPGMATGVLPLQPGATLPYPFAGIPVGPRGRV